MPARKKQATDDAGASVATGRKKAAATRAVSKTKATTRATTKTKRETAAGAPEAPNGGKKQDLVIVESPTKAKTITKYLGPGYRVLASMGHVRDLPKRRKKGEAVAGVDIDQGWVPSYVVVDDKHEKLLSEIKREAARSNRVFLATDPDREGEAIAWHIEDALGLEDFRTFRVAFQEITRSAVQNAISQPGKIDRDRVKAQEARRILDRVVGFPLSGLLRRKVASGSSAGRVQSVALRLVVDREREIEAFQTTEFWKITALLAPTGTVPFTPRPFSVVLSKKKDAKADGEAKEEKREGPAVPPPPEGAFAAELAEWAGKKFEAGSQEQSSAIAAALDTAAYVVTAIEQKDRPEKPPAPFTTSTLQQQASIRLRFNAERTMKTAQRLYEGLPLGGEGQVALITYMRTDSTRVSNEALQAVRQHIEATYGSPYLPASPNVYASGKSAQEAHEAIRPVDLSYTPERVAQLGLQGGELRLYTLIYNRFVASQMTPAVFAVTNVSVTATPQPGVRGQESGIRGQESGISDTLAPVQGVFKAQGKVLKFDGYRRVLAPVGKQEDATLPALAAQQALDKLDLIASQHWTQPPPRYTEASLIKALEKEGIGRPSTYATIMKKITDEERNFIQVKDRRFYATDIGKAVTDLLLKHFPRIVDVKFTSHMEEELDQIAAREIAYEQVLNEFWGPFSEALRVAEEQMPKQRGVETGELCPKCGKPLVKNFSKKTGREFIGCSGWKEGCKYIKPREGEEERPEPKETDVACPTCGKPMIERMGRSGPFLGCSGYPECKTTMNFDAEGKPVLATKPTEHVCEKCGSPMVIREGRRGPFLACTGYPKCKNAKDVDAQGNPVEPITVDVKCEKCGSPMAVKKGPRGPFLGCSAYPKCRSTKPMPADLKEQLKDKLPTPAKKAMPAVEVSETCPECGAPMKLRQGRSGYFLGCSKYPRCRGTREPSPELMEQLQAAPTA